MNTSNKVLDPYNRRAEILVNQYESRSFEDIHSDILDLLPVEAGFILDVGAGSGRDAAWFANQGNEVVAVEPADQMRQAAKIRHPEPDIRWINDAMPSLAKVIRTGLTFDLIWLSAVWMHIAPTDRQRTFRKLVTLLRPSGKIMVSLRSGPMPEDRVMYRASQDEIESLARRFGLAVVYAGKAKDKLGRNEISWKTVVLQLPNDGLGALPLLRHVILNDSKASTYKLALLRVLVRIADSATGLVADQGEESVSVPLGLVALYWIRAYKPLIERGIPQKPKNTNNSGLGFVKDGFIGLSHVSPFDLRLGSRFTGKTAASLLQALRDARNTIVHMPANYITYPNQDQAVFLCKTRRLRTSSSFTLNHEFLESFGTLTIPCYLWQAMGRYAAWIEPALLNEWVELMRGYEGGEQTSYEDHFQLLRWLDPEHDTRMVRNRVDAIRNGGQPVYCLWSGKPLREAFAVDHCLPFAAWPCNDLWNLFPSNPRINAQKKDRLPTTVTLLESKNHVLDWWDSAWNSPDLQDRFLDEAVAALPGATLSDNALSLEDVFEGLLLQRAVLERDQQLQEWSYC